ncbi:MAG: T9SS type A sorting domain-containing protein [Candidatus Marinimicrobia bacterium]|nr:T9SS type A sorting domain-containing protein [Candidatus Neomarinimicrobiota bacterium]
MKYLTTILTTIVLLTSITTAQNYSVGFNLNDGYISSDASSETIFQGVTSFSVEAWYKNPGIVSGPNSNYAGNAGSCAIISNYNRHSGGDPYNNFGLNIDGPAGSNPGYVTFLGTVSNEQLDDDQWHHIAGVYDHSVGESYLFIDGVLNDSYTLSDDFLSSSNKIYINHKGLIAGVYHMDSDVASTRITDGVRYSSGFTPAFPLASESNSIIALDFTTGSGTTLSDLSGNGNNFTLYDGAAWGTDVPTITTTPSNTHSLSFDGVDDYVIINSSPELSGLSQFTLNLWLLKPSNSNVSNVESIVNKFGSGGQNGSNYEFDFYGEWQNSISMGIKTTENNTFTVGIPGSSLQLDQWQNVAITYDGEYMKSYLDGQLMNTTSAYGTLLTTSEPINIGRYFGGYYFEGNIDEISFWNVALAESQIQSYMTTSPAVGETGLVAYWNFNEGSGATASDATSNGNDGTIYGATWSTDVPFEGSTTTTEEISAVVTVGETNAYVIEAMYTDTVLVPILIDSLSDGISAGEFRFTGFQDGIEFLDVVTDSSLVGDAGWTIVTNDLDTLLITVGYGSTDIDTSGILFFLKAAVSDTMTEGLTPIEIVEIELNESSDEITVHDGGINIFNPILGDVSENGDVSAFDASLILKYLVETEELVYPQILSADVTFDGEITALDASVIAQFVAELIDTLPYSDSTLLAGSGDFGIDDGEFTPGEVLQVPIQLYNGSNLLSYEMDLNFDPEILSYSGIEFSEMVDHFMMEENQMNGSLKLAGAGATPDGQEGGFATISFTIGNDVENETIEIGINHYRTNENEIQDGSTATFTNSTLAVNPDFIPNDFVLHQNYPNPFNPVTTLRYDLPEQAHVEIMIYDIMGREVRHLVNQTQDAGFKSVVWDATNNLGEPVSAGMYLYRISTVNFSKTMKMVVLK